ncbi:MAG: putative metal-dependent hydrolase [Bacteroidia bacterium]|nr:putative metal-dependent hydrolase [Bacteroidia bacterium]
MNAQALYNLKFPIGEFEKPNVLDVEQLNAWLQVIKTFPGQLAETVNDLTNSQKGWRYRPDGWNIKQVVHHCADSHANGYIRFRLALTEERPTIRPYIESRWAELYDANEDDLSDSLLILTSIHNRWHRLMNTFTQTQWERVLIHPEHKAPLVLSEYLGNYAWHCEHHLAHVKQALKAEGTYN